MSYVRKKNTSSRKYDVRSWFSTGQAYLYLLPAFIILGIFSYAPSIFVFYMSLFDWSFLNKGVQPFAGLSNYSFLWRSPDFWQALRVTVIYVLVSVPLHVVLALLLALCLMSGIRAMAFWRLAVFAPFITPIVATTTVWVLIFDRYHGLFNGVLHLLNLRPIDWLGDPRWTLFSIIVYTTWKSLGFSVVIFMSGLGNISPSLAEAARIDGANSWQILRYVTWPLLKPITLVVLLLSTIEAFKMFQPAFLLTGPAGGPGNVARTLGLYLFSEGFSTDPRDGRGAAISVILFLLVFTISVAQLGLTQRRDNALY
ncbi:MAG: sugar ABC transporter permease [Ktedonobacteraceae bacterium]